MKKCAVSSEHALKDMVKVKKLRFKDQEEPNLTAPQSKTNFGKFTETYATQNPVHKSVDHVPQTGCFYYKKKLPVETINIELPYHFGGDRAVHQMYQNKIKPKISSTKVGKGIMKQGVKSTKSLVIEAKLGKSDEKIDSKVPEVVKSQLLLNKQSVTSMPKIDIQKPAVKKKKPDNESKIIDVLSNINKKLEKMQETYLNKPKIAYKNVNDCFTQYGDAEMLYENFEHPDPSTKIQDGISELPKFEDTAREIDRHLENIFKLNSSSSDIQRKIDNNNEKLYEELYDDDGISAWESELINAPQCKMSAEEILKRQRQNKKQKLRTIQRDIEQVEDFYDKLSEITHDDECVDDLPKTPYQKPDPPINPSDFIEGPDLQGTIKKSDYLSKEFVEFVENPVLPNPMIKIFSENRKLIWKEDKSRHDCSVESVTKMIDALKFTLENSIYDPVT